ncbi:hypothetical protein JNB_04725 [Janibacter sp. HTCC2649]|uniref:hypothetical protein n=1 Tax=Janibacter sp. HTCC2649 TaxID=313589 RepID=UPI000066E96A|nr:hypothetical protein [Janibacter sp. HTCC2649]EAP99447.1 hypothetical protein JNB_04725 [Janibacter sp. HTCC2649]
MATDDAYADHSEYDPPIELRPLNLAEQMAAQLRRQAQENDDPVPPIGGAYSRERMGR